MPKPFDIGTLRHRLTHQVAVTVDQEPSPAGVPPQTAAETWEDRGKHWASIEPQRVRRTIGVDAPRSSLWSIVRIRNTGSANQISSKDRFLFVVPSGTRILTVDSVQRMGELNEYLEIEVTEPSV